MYKIHIYQSEFTNLWTWQITKKGLADVWHLIEAGGEFYGYLMAAEDAYHKYNEVTK